MIKKECAMPEDPPTSPLSPWKGCDIVSFVLMLFPAMSIAAIYGDSAKYLGIPGAELAQVSPLLMIASFIVIPLVMAGGRLTETRRYGITMGAVLFWMIFPPLFLVLGSVRIPLSKKMDSEEMKALREILKIPMLLTNDSTDGDCLRVRRWDYSDAVKAAVLSVGNSGPK